MAPPVEAVVKKPKGSRTVVLLKNDDYSRKNGKVYIPNTIEMAQIKKPIRGQYNKYVQFSKNMDEDMVKRQLQEAFPTFDLMNGRFSCAAVSQDCNTFQFHGTPRVWDGETIKRKIKGNSVLYIVMEGDQVPQQSQLYTATEGCGSSTDACVNPVNNTIHQTKDQTNPMNLHVSFNGELMPFHEPAALDKDIGETPCIVAETEMEVDDSQQGNDDQLAMYSISASSVDQMVSDTSEDVFSSTDNATTSGMVSGSDPECSEEDRLIQWLRNVGNLQISINPMESPLEGGAPCLFTFNPMLHSEVTSGHANFENLAMVPLERLRNGSLHGIIPASQQPGLVSVTLTSQHGICLGKTHIKYYGRKEVLNTIVRSPTLVKEICEEYSTVYGFGETNMEAINSGILGITDPMPLFRLLVYTAAEVGAQQFIEMIFNSSAGRVVFEAYKGSSQLPEVIARDHGNEETAQYLERLTKRFSDEIRSGKECSQTIDWSELAKAAKAAQKKFDLTNEKEDGLDKRNDPKETGYSGDADSSSSEASAPQSSDSEDDISARTKPTTTATTTATRKGSVSSRECKTGQKELHGEDHKRDNEDPTAESYSGKKGEIWQQGDLHGKDRNRDTEDPIADLTREKEDDEMRKDISKETGYLGDVDTSSIESMEAQSSDSDDISSTSRKEFKDDSIDLTRQALTLDSHTIGQQNPEETYNAEIISKNCTSHTKHETTDIKVEGTEICSQRCKLKILEVQADSHADFKMFLYSPMPVIQKRGCMNTSWYSTIIAKLREKQNTGDFDGHEQLFEKQMAKLKTEADSDMKMSLQIERAMMLYFQNNLKDAKKILKIVVKQENQLKNPGILVGRALNLLTAVYKRQKKFGNAMKSVERARTCLEGQDSTYDKAELHHSYGALISAMPASKNPETVRTMKEEAYKSYQMADHYEFQKYHHVKMAALLLESRGRNFPCKEDLTKATKHLDFLEPKLAESKSLGSEIKFLLLRSDQYLYEGKVPMAMEKAQEASALIDVHGFELESASAKSRIYRLSSMVRQENLEWRETEFGSSSDTSGYFTESEYNYPMAMEKAQEASALVHQHGFELESAPAKSRIDRETEFGSSSDTSGYLTESESAYSDQFGKER